MALNMEDLQRNLHRRTSVLKQNQHTDIEQFYEKIGVPVGTPVEARHILGALRRLVGANCHCPPIYVDRHDVTNFLISLNEPNLIVNDVKESGLGQMSCKEYLNEYMNVGADYMMLWEGDELAIYRDGENPMPAYELVELPNEETRHQYDMFLYELIDAAPAVTRDMVPHALDENMVIPMRMLYVEDSSNGLIPFPSYNENRPSENPLHGAEHVMLLNATVDGICERAFVADLLQLPEVKAYRQLPRKYISTRLAKHMFNKASVAICNIARRHSGLHPLPQGGNQ